MNSLRIKCKNCGRLLPKKSFRTFRGCIWCEGIHSKKENKITKNMDIIIIIILFGFTISILKELVVLFKNKGDKND